MGREIDKETNNVILTNFKKKEDYINYIMHKKKLEESSYDEIKNIIDLKDKGVLYKPYDIELNKAIDFIYERKKQENNRLRKSLNKKMGQQLYVMALLLTKLCYEFSGISMVEDNNYSISQRLIVAIVFIVSISILCISKVIFYTESAQKSNIDG